MVSEESVLKKRKKNDYDPRSRCPQSDLEDEMGTSWSFSDLISGQGIDFCGPSSNINLPTSATRQSDLRDRPGGGGEASGHQVPSSALSLYSLNNSWLGLLFALVAKSTSFISVPSPNPVGAQDAGDYRGWILELRPRDLPLRF